METKANQIRVSNKVLGFVISFLYVGFGTIFSLIYWTDANPMGLNETFGNILFGIFVPTSFISILILFTERDPVMLVAFTQLITFFLFWYLASFCLSIFKNEKNDEN